MEIVFNDNDTKALIAKKQLSDLRDLNVSLFTIRDLINIIEPPYGIFSRVGQARISLLYKKYISENSDETI